jgi:hypothetical protein
MSINEIRKKLLDAIDQAVSKSKVDLSMIPEKDKASLVEEITDAVLLTFDSWIDESAERVNTNDDLLDTGEEILWKGRPFLSLTESYIVTTERIKIITGFISRDVENFELIRIQDIDYGQNIGERILGLGDINIRGHDPSDPVVVLRNITKPEEVYELLRKSWLQARKKHGLQFREYM